METFLDVLDALAEADDAKGFTFIAADGGERKLGWPTLGREVLARGRKLLASGLGAGDRLAIIIPEPDQFVLTFLGAVSAGIVPVPLYPPLALSNLDVYLESTARTLEAAAAHMLITTGWIERILSSVVDKVPTLRALVTVEGLPEGGAAREQRPRVLPSDPMFLQFTSGSTAAPKGVVVTHRSLLANSACIFDEGLGGARSEDVGVSWLPLYHDMGLIGFVLAPLARQVPVVFIPTLDFVRRPALWMEVIHRHRASITFAPNFAFARVTKRASEADLGRWDLSCLRAVGCGAEPINAGTMRAFVERFGRCGLKPEAMLPCYGMAEATLAMTFVGLSEELKFDAGAVGMPDNVSCGRPFLNHEIAIFDEAGDRLPERAVGEIRFRGPSVAAGYFRNHDATRQTFGADGWLRTGDLGYLAGGELYISGRSKDIIIIHGRNYYPQGIEWHVEELPGIRKGNVVAFSVPGAETEELVIVAETAEADPGKRQALAAQVKKHLSTTLSLAAADVVLIGVAELPKTTSGKLQRHKTREQYLAKALAKDGARTLGSTTETRKDLLT